MRLGRPIDCAPFANGCIRRRVIEADRCEGPLFDPKRPFLVAFSPGRRCQRFVAAWRTMLPIKKRSFSFRLLDDLVSAGEQRWRDSEAERIGGFEVDHQLELGWLLDRQVGGFRAFQDLVDEDRPDET
jgi:hypothetical protein